MAKTVIHLVRHGQYSRLIPDETGGEPATEWAVRSDGGLTPLGAEQAGLTAGRLREYPVGAIHCSSLPRAAQTAAIIAEEFPGIRVQSSRLLWECIPYVSPSIAALLPSLPEEDIARGQERAAQAYERYIERAPTGEPSTGKASTRNAPTGKASTGNVSTGNVPTGSDHEVVVCHGNLIRYFVARVMGGELDAWVRMGTFHCGISQIEIVDDWAVLVCHNDSGHLPADKRTGS
jgi:serine/threonine-protein phosphatase PGAM5